MRRLVLPAVLLLAAGVAFLMLHSSGPTSVEEVERARTDEDGATPPLRREPTLEGAAEVPSTAGEATADLAVRVLVGADAAPPGIEVSLSPDVEHPAWTRTTATDASGTARFPALPAGEYKVGAWAEGRAPAGQAFDWYADGSDEALDLELEEGIPFDGRVVDAGTGLPIAGARVVLLFGDPGELGPTDAEGRFHVPGVADREDNDLVVYAEGYVAQRQRVLTDSGCVHPPVVVFRLEAAGRLTGRVLSAGGEPVAGARVRLVPHTDEPEEAYTLEERTRSYEGRDWDDIEVYEDEQVLHALTGADGAFRVDGLAFDRSYDVSAGAAGHADSPVPSDVRATPARPVCDRELRLRAPGRVLLRVTCPGDEALPPRARVRVFEAERMRVPSGTDAQGRHVFEGVDPGPCDAFVEATGYLPAALPLHVREGETIEAEIALETGNDVRGLVLDPEGRPVMYATVQAAPVARNPEPDREYLLGARTANTDRYGRFEIGGLPPGEILLIAQDSRGELITPEIKRCTPPADSQRLVLERCGRVRARLLLPSGAPFAGHIVVCLGRIASGRDTRDGVFEEPCVAKGAVRLLISAPGCAWLQREVEVRDGATTDLGDLVAHEGEVVSGRVEDDTGSPVAGASIACLESYYRKTLTDGEGRFSMDDFPHGGFTLTASADGLVACPVHVRPDGMADVRIRMSRPARVRGVVRRSDGEPAGKVVIAFRMLDAEPGEHVLQENEFVSHVLVRDGVGYVASEKDGRFDALLPPGRCVGSWKDDAGDEQRVGTWTLEAGRTHEIEIVLPQD